MPLETGASWLFSWLWSRIFVFQPKILRHNGQLIARSGWRSQLFTLGFAGRQIVVDRQRHLIRIRTRSFWFARKTRFIPFNAVDEVTYDHHDIDPAGETLSWSHQQDDLFTVGLKLKSGEYVTLFKYYGAGDFSNNSDFPDWFFWEDKLEARLTMQNCEGESRAYAYSIAAVIGVEVGNAGP
jgi:hypothetical protein